MRWYAHIYAGKYASAYRPSILNGLRNRRHMPSVFVVTRALGPDALLDIYPSSIFRKKFIQDQDPLVLGIAMSKSEAFQVASCIIRDMYSQNGDFDIDAFCDSGNS